MSEIRRTGSEDECGLAREEERLYECKRCDSETSGELSLNGQIVCHVCYYEDSTVQAELARDEKRRHDDDAA